MPQDDCLDRELTVRENLYIYGRYFGLRKPVIRDRLARLIATHITREVLEVRFPVGEQEAAAERIRVSAADRLTRHACGAPTAAGWRSTGRRGGERS